MILYKTKRQWLLIASRKRTSKQNMIIKLQIHEECYWQIEKSSQQWLKYEKYNKMKSKWQVSVL